MLKKHGSKQIELSGYFEISKESPKVLYEINMWIFIPASLNNNSYSKEEFFDDFNSYTRYNAPNLTLNSLNDFLNPKNPLTRLQNISHTKDNFNLIEYELKTLLNILKVASIKELATLEAMSRFSRYEAERNAEVQIEKLEDILNKLQKISKTSPSIFSTIYNLSLEGVSLRIEKSLYRMYQLFPNKRTFIISKIDTQRFFREEMGFKSITTDDENLNSQVIYREHLIKKWSESIMYITMEKSKTLGGIGHIFLGSAAAIAMLIAGIITILTARWLGQNSFYWFLTAMLAYSLKDRIKEILKAIFLRKMSTLFSDRVNDIVAPRNRHRCGKSKESVSFPKFYNITSDVKTLRFNDKHDLDIKKYQEDIIHYKKSVTIRTKTLYKKHSRLFGIKEIMRFDFRRWFHKMDKKTERCFMPKGESLAPVKGDREYHFTLIIKVRNNNKTTLERYRIIANSHKIRKIEKESKRLDEED